MGVMGRVGKYVWMGELEWVLRRVKEQVGAGYRLEKWGYWRNGLGWWVQRVPEEEDAGGSVWGVDGWW